MHVKLAALCAVVIIALGVLEIFAPGFVKKVESYLDTHSGLGEILSRRIIGIILIIIGVILLYNLMMVPGL